MIWFGTCVQVVKVAMRKGLATIGTEECTVSENIDALGGGRCWLRVECSCNIRIVEGGDPGACTEECMLENVDALGGGLVKGAGCVLNVCVLLENTPLFD